MSTEQVSNEPSGLTLRSALQPTVALRRQFALLAKQIREWAIDRQPPAAIGVVGIRPGVGVSTVAFNLAYVLAQTTRENNLLIEATFGKSFALKNQVTGRDLRGVLQSGQDIADCFAQTERPNFLVLASGLDQERRGVDVAWGGLKPLIREQLNSFRYVIVDLPPISEPDACSIVASNLDGLVVVTDEPRGDTSQLAAFRQELESAGVEFIGIVINKVKS